VPESFAVDVRLWMGTSYTTINNYS